MIIRFHRNFEKQFSKLHPAERKKFQERKDLFIQNPFHSLLNNHALSGSYAGYRSINITGDLRAVYRVVNASFVVFTEIGTHHELYGS